MHDQDKDPANRDKDVEGRRYAGYGSDKGKREADKHQRDPEQDTGHMPRHWQEPGARGEVPGQPVPPPDRRETARGNQYGKAGELAGEQVRQDLTEHGKEAPPQRRDNEQMGKRPGEGEKTLPTQQDTRRK